MKLSQGTEQDKSRWQFWETLANSKSSKKFEGSNKRSGACFVSGFRAMLSNLIKQFLFSSNLAFVCFLVNWMCCANYLQEFENLMFKLG